MNSSVKITVVEDEMLIGANISLQLNRLGYEVTGILPRGEEVAQHLIETNPDLVLLDINLKGKLDGIETAQLIQKIRDVPIIYLTANTDEAHFNRAKATHPYAFISKPFKKLDLQRAIELTLSQIEREREQKAEQVAENAPVVLNDSIFVRHHDTMVRVVIADILYIEAERNYCRIFSKTKEYLLVLTLKEMAEKLPEPYFLRVHRSYIVNIAQIEEVATAHVVIARKTVPLSKAYKPVLLQRLQTI